jgi:hypothetical protein
MATHAAGHTKRLHLSAALCEMADRIDAHPRPDNEDAPGGPKVEHRCGVQGFDCMKNTCPACERDALNREVRDRLKGDEK